VAAERGKPLSRARRSVAAGCGSAVLFAASPALAADADPWLSGLARHLRAQPVFVSDSVSRAVSPAELKRLRAAVRAMAVPTRVAIISGPPGNFDLRGPNPSELPLLLAGAVDRRGLYVVADATGGAGSIDLATVGARTRVAPDEVEHALLHDVSSDDRVVTAILYALSVAATGKRTLLGAGDRARDAATRRQDARDSSAPEERVALGFGSAGILAGLALPTVLWRRRRLREAPRTRPRSARRGRGSQRPLGPPVVREPDTDVAAQAARAIEGLASAIAAAPQPSDEAFELYSAAAKADREARTPVDHYGALLLTRDAKAALRGRARPRRCFFDPGHDGPTDDTRWRLGQREAEVPACAGCVRALAADRTPDTLGDRGRPYYERDTIWARTGFGSIDDELAAKLLSGR
jgi:hypothetical protein